MCGVQNVVGLPRPVQPVPLEAADVVDPGVPDQVDAFDLLWARQLMRLVLDRVREECEAANQAHYWGLFDRRLLSPALEGGKPTPYADCIGELGFASVAEACNALVTVQRRFRRALRASVAEYVGQSDVEEEIAALHSVFATQAQAFDGIDLAR